MKQEPLRASYIVFRKIAMESANEPIPTLPSHLITNEDVLMKFAKSFSHNAKVCNESGFHILFSSVEELDKKEGRCHNQVHSFICNEIIPKMNKKALKEALQEVKNSDDEFVNKETYYSVIENGIVVDRILINEKSLSKRFNFDKLASSCKSANMDCANTVYEMCDLIDTYDISPEAKFNIALENVTYTMGKVGFSSGDVSKAVVDYFLLTPVIPDAVYETTQSLVKNCKLLSDKDKSELSYFTEAKNDRYKTEITYLAYKCSTDEAKNLIISSISIKSEKDASSYIKKAVYAASSSVDGKHIISSIFMIPLRGKVSKSFVAYQYRLAKDKAKMETKFDKEFEKQIETIIDDEDDILIKEAFLLTDMDEDIGEQQVVEVVSGYYPNTSIMESENFGDSEDIKKILGDFKAEQKKSMGKFKYYLGKIYRKSPEAIIDETPNILGIIRIVFILAPSVIPVIGVPLTLVAVFIDRLITMGINEKQTENLIKKLDAEIDKVDKDIEKRPEKKEELEKYKKCIQSSLVKVEAYRKTITDNDIEGRKGSSSSGNDDFDFDLDFELEQSLVGLNAMNIVMDAYQDNTLTDKVCNIFNEFAKEEPITYDIFNSLLEVCANCGESINMNKIFERANQFRSENSDSAIQLAKMGTALNEMSYNLDKYRASTEMALDRVISEAYYTEQLQEVISEGFNLNKLKLLFQMAKQKGKDLSTKEKAFWKNMDIMTSGFMRNVEKAMTSDRREGIIKGSLIPSFSKCMRSAIAIGALTFINPVLGLITAMGTIALSKKLNNKERQLIYDEIETELKVVEKEIEMANNDGDMKKYRCMLQYQKRLERERQRIKYGIKAHGRDAALYMNTSPKGGH